MASHEREALCVLLNPIVATVTSKFQFTFKAKADFLKDVCFVFSLLNTMRAGVLQQLESRQKVPMTVAFSFPKAVKAKVGYHSAKRPETSRLVDPACAKRSGRML